MYHVMLNIAPDNGAAYKRLYVSELEPSDMLTLAGCEVEGVVTLEAHKDVGEGMAIQEASRLKALYPKSQEATSFRPRITPEGKYAFTDYQGDDLLLARRIVQDEELEIDGETMDDSSPVSFALAKHGGMNYFFLDHLLKRVWKHYWKRRKNKKAPFLLCLHNIVIFLRNRKYIFTV